MTKSGWKSAMVVFEDAAAPGADAGSQKELAGEQRRVLADYLEEAGLTGEVELPPASPLPSLVVEGSDRGLDACLRAPSVKEVLKISGDIEMEPL